MSDAGALLIVAEDLDKEYRSGPEMLRVLRGASLILRAGEMVALVGASGVGKSTLLHILGAVDRPTAGRVLFAGEDVFARSEAALTRFRRQEVGFVFQFYNLLSEMTALENAMVPALLQRVPTREAGRRGPPPPMRSPTSGSATASSTARASFPEANNSGLPSLARS
jgi:lipoprotein-releasing system ATP-binding protein